MKFKVSEEPSSVQIEDVEEKNVSVKDDAKLYTDLQKIIRVRLNLIKESVDVIEGALATLTSLSNEGDD